MSIPNAYTKKPCSEEEKKSIKIANIIYYDENIVKHLEAIHKDSDYFERKTSGAFVLITNMSSFNLVMEEIREYNSPIKRALFNLIVTGRQFQKIIDHLIKYELEQFIQNIFIYCMKVEK